MPESGTSGSEGGWGGQPPWPTRPIPTSVRDTHSRPCRTPRRGTCVLTGSRRVSGVPPDDIQTGWTSPEGRRPSADAAGDVGFGAGVAGVGEELLGGADLGDHAGAVAALDGGL